MKRNQEFFKGCLIGGAIGDALGWLVEFLQYEDIIKKCGKEGVQDLVCSTYGKAEVSDDTQMTLFTAEGILRSETSKNTKGIYNPISAVYNAYQRWLCTQGYPKLKNQDYIYDGWLFGVETLHERRAPGNTCISSLASSRQGSIENPLNNSKGCGGIMRVAPAGLFYPKETAFKMAADFAALTHGHPSGYLSAGASAYIIADIISGAELEASVKAAFIELSKYKDHEECCHALQQAIALSKSDVRPLDAITELGQGWVGDEALSISVYCALKYKDNFKKAVTTSVNHNGDSDSTGAITGNILGAYLGVNNIPKDWINKVELKDEIFMIADDLLTGYKEDEEWSRRYPGY